MKISLRLRKCDIKDDTEYENSDYVSYKRFLCRVVNNIDDILYDKSKDAIIDTVNNMDINIVDNINHMSDNIKDTQNTSNLINSTYLEKIDNIMPWVSYNEVTYYSLNQYNGRTNRNHAIHGRVS